MTKKTIIDTEKVWGAISERAKCQGKPDMDAWAEERGLPYGMGAIIIRTIEDAEMTEGKCRAKAVAEAQIDDAQIDENDEAH